MTVDQIMVAFRMIAMGRPNHPDVLALAEHLAAGAPAPVVEPEQAEDDKPKRGRKKAD